MSLSPYIEKDSSNVWWLKWTSDPDAIAYDAVVNSNHVQAGKGATSIKLGTTKPATLPIIAPAHTAVYETAVDKTVPPPFSVRSSIPDNTNLVVPTIWEAIPSSAVSKVEFYIDDKLTTTEYQTPYICFGDAGKLDPTKLSDGSHKLKIVAYSTDNQTATLNSTLIIHAAPTPPPTTPPPTAGLTKILFAPQAGSWLDPVMNTNDAAWKTYVQTKYYRISELWGSKWATFFKNGHVYIDLLAIYRNSQVDFNQVLHNSAGKPLYIDYACSNGVCTQFNADPANPTFRANQIKRCKDALAMGYVGVFLDDTNLPFNFSDGFSNGQIPVGYTQDTYKNAVCNLVEEIRAAIPNAEITHNSRWSDSPNHDGRDPYVERQIKAADWVCKEFGAIDGGLTGGTGSWSMHRLFSYCDHVHELGRSVNWLSYANNVKDATANLACYLLCKENRDVVCSNTGAFPNNPFPPYDIDPGISQGVRVFNPTNNTWVREFVKLHVGYDHNTRTGTLTPK